MLQFYRIIWLIRGLRWIKGMLNVEGDNSQELITSVKVFGFAISEDKSTSQHNHIWE